MAWVDQHKMHNSFSTSNLYAKNTDDIMAKVEIPVVISFGKADLRNNQ
jgi:hypothetical protein